MCDRGCWFMVHYKNLRQSLEMSFINFSISICDYVCSSKLIGSDLEHSALDLI